MKAGVLADAQDLSMTGKSNSSAQLFAAAISKMNMNYKCKYHRQIARSQLLLVTAVILCLSAAGVAAAADNPAHDHATSRPPRPNIVLIVTDQERYPPAYTPEHIRQWIHSLPGKRRLDGNGAATHFVSHRTTSTACSPSRATLYTGHTPAVHGVTQTYGLAKAVNDPEMSWLDATQVPTMGDYFRAGGYDTYYIGKWHVSFEDLIDDNGYIVEDPEAYAKANRLDKFGWNGWKGPEPHGASLSNSGWRRDPGYVQEFKEFLAWKEQQQLPPEKPWMVAINLVNPHDICFPDIYWRLAGLAPLFDDDTPVPPLPPTFHEDLAQNGKPKVQAEYRKVLREMGLTPQFWQDVVRAYLFLVKAVDQHVDRILTMLEESPVFRDNNNNTIVAQTADHGDMLGAHGGMAQKWHQAYEEALHIPLVIRDYRLAKQDVNPVVDIPTQSLDVLPTLISVAGLDEKNLQKQLLATHSEVHRFPGRDLRPLISKDSAAQIIRGWTVANDTNEGIRGLTYFQLEDVISRGQSQENILVKNFPLLRLLGNWNYNAIGKDSPVQMEAIVYRRAGDEHTIKFVRYFDDPQSWTERGVRDIRTEQKGLFRLPYLTSFGQKIYKTKPLPEAWELYDLTNDPNEEVNLASSTSPLEEPKQLLNAARRHYRISRNHPLPPPAVRNAHLPAMVREHGEFPLVIRFVGTCVPIIIYMVGISTMFWLARKSLTKTKAEVGKAKQA